MNIRIMPFYVKILATISICFGLVPICGAQNAPAPQAAEGQKPADQAAPPPAAPAAPTALPTPAITGPLASPPPAMFDAGPFGKIAVNGILDGMGMWTGNYVQGDNSTHAALS